jgi:hypothetical protein
LKKIIFRIMTSLIFTLILISCSNMENSGIILNNSSKDSSYLDIKVESPMTISNNHLHFVNGEQQYMGSIWEGYYVLELADESGNVIYQADLSEIHTEPLIFKYSFKISFADYNNDGDIDFTIGQYISSSVSEFKLFTLRKDGKIEELPVKDYSSLLISNTDDIYSPLLTKLDDVTFKTEYYDNAKGQLVENTFSWRGKEFVKN